MSSCLSRVEAIHEDGQVYVLLATEIIHEEKFTVTARFLDGRVAVLTKYVPDVFDLVWPR